MTDDPNLIVSAKLDCTFEFPNGNRHEALAHLFQHEYMGHVFWHGVAEFSEPVMEIPEGLNGGQVVFENRSEGVVSFRGGEMSAGYFQLVFVGLSQLTSSP